MNTIGNTICLAVVQYKMGSNRQKNLEKACHFVRQAATKGAHIVLLPELFEHPYFPKKTRRSHFKLAEPADQSRAVRALGLLAQELGVVIPTSFFELKEDTYFNSVAIIDADGKCLGIYRKSHIPDGPGYQEKFYFEMGDTGFRVFQTCYARLGVGICWDQWFPECARAMTLMGAELLVYPSAIGSEPNFPQLDTRDAWQKVMVGHAISNSIPIAASNRVGCEESQLFYGSSFTVDHLGIIKSEMDRVTEGFQLANIDLMESHRFRDWFGLMDDRRPELYQILTESSKELG